MYRQELVDILKQSVPSSCTMHFDKRLTKSEKRGKRHPLPSAEDTIDPSKIRHYSDPSWTGTLVCRSIFPAEKLSKLDPNNLALKDFTIVRNNLYFAVLREGKVSAVSLEEVVEAYKDFAPDAKCLLNCFENPSRWALHVVNELPLFTWDRVALIGDAAHAMTPHFGAGAGQVIEDVFVLGRLLAHPLTTLDNVPTALKAYQDVRLPFAQFVARQSERSTGQMYDFCALKTDRGNEREEIKILKEKIIDLWENWDSEGEGGAVAE
ncbi:hypothetical protein C8R48DRAFT_793897 [Suillus tomentosus]|nr:hypothetical protein C8R48DRAFT_793897 [Suillus tomentosus]